MKKAVLRELLEKRNKPVEVKKNNKKEVKEEIKEVEEKTEEIINPVEIGE